MANDPHLTSFVPSMMYAIEIVLLDQNNQAKIQTFGLMADGLPSISIGVNNKYAWGSTAGYIDNKDVFH